MKTVIVQITQYRSRLEVHTKIPRPAGQGIQVVIESGDMTIGKSNDQGLTCSRYQHPGCGSQRQVVPQIGLCFQDRSV